MDKRLHTHDTHIDDSALRSFPPRVRALLLTRNILTEEDAQTFLYPEWERDIHDPFLLEDMTKAVERVRRAIASQEHIALWSDYDMDGIPGAVVLTDFFHAIGYKKISHYTPHRNKEGFGLNEEGIALLAEEGVTVLITIDCGSTDVSAVQYAKERGIDVIITDHHELPEKLPSSYAILNPKREGSLYPEPMLCGAGVVFKFVQAFLSRYRDDETLTIPKKGWEKWLLDMVGMATIADMVPLTGENRVFAYFGLLVLKKSRRPGLQALLKKARAHQQYLTEDDVAFSIAPRINAASRMGHARDAYALLVSGDSKEAYALSDVLEKINKERKVAVATMKREIHRKLQHRTSETPVLVFGSPAWKPSLLGLVAGSLAQEHKKPVFLWGREEGVVIKGSCRSEGTTNVYDLMHTVKNRFMEYGGHAYSGGFSLEEHEIHELEPALIDAYQRLVQEKEHTEPMFDDMLALEDVTWETYREIAQLAPFGEGNRKPVFKLSDVLVHAVRMFGKGSEHIEIQFLNTTGNTVKAISFFSDKESFTCPPETGLRVSILAHLEASFFLGRKELRLRLIDVLP